MPTHKLAKQIDIHPDRLHSSLGQVLPSGTKVFHVADILTVSTGFMLSPRKIDAVDDIHYCLDIPAGNLDPHMEDRFVAYAIEAKEEIKRQLPWTQSIGKLEYPKDAPEEFNQIVTAEFVARVAAQVGEYHYISPAKLRANFGNILSLGKLNAKQLDGVSVS